MDPERNAIANRYSVLLAARVDGRAVLRDVSRWPVYSGKSIDEFVLWLETNEPERRVVVIDWGEASRKEDV